MLASVKGIKGCSTEGGSENEGHAAVDSLGVATVGLGKCDEACAEVDAKNSPAVVATDTDTVVTLLNSESTRLGPILDADDVDDLGDFCDLGAAAENGVPKCEGYKRCTPLVWWALLSSLLAQHLP